MPFGLNTRQQNAWMYLGGGSSCSASSSRSTTSSSFPCGNTGAQMGGWFRKEIKTVDDLKGLKFRIGGFAGQVLAKLGVVPQQIAGGDIYPALEKGTIDAAEWVGPYDDEKLGFNKVAKFYYYPGWWEGGAQLAMLRELEAVRGAAEGLPGDRSRAACAEAQRLDDGEVRRAEPGGAAPAGRRRRRSCARSRATVMEACYKATFELYDEIAAKNAKFKKIYDAWKQVRDEEHLWFRVSEHPFDNFVYGQSAAQARRR